MADTTFHSIKLPGMDDAARVPSVAEEFTTGTTYEIRDYCTYQGKLYKCKTKHEAGVWNANNFEEIRIDTEISGKLNIPLSQPGIPLNPKEGDLWIDSDENSPIYNVDPQPISGSTNAVQSGGTKTALNALDERKMEHGIITGDFSESVDYRVGDLVFHVPTSGNEITSRLLYRCIVDHDSTSWNDAHFTKTTLEIELQRIRDNEAETDMIGDLFGSKSSYAIGDYCVYNTNLYRCIRPVDNTNTNAPSFNEADWTQIKLSNEVASSMNILTRANSILTNEVTTNIVNYDASRINNGKAVDRTTGNAYSQTGRCMTNALNGSLYPMDAVYIDSSLYSFRMFGYSGMPTTNETYLGCTEYIIGGKNNILYRDQSWAICRLVIARNNTSNYTPFTTSEIEDIASKINLITLYDLQSNIQENSNKINEVTEKVDNITNYTIGSIAGISSYAFSNVGHYDSARLNNGKTLADKTSETSPGAMIDAPGQCVTNSLNGELYPMDGIYIDSDAYCIRLFGFEGPSTAPAYFIDCTDFETGGAKKILYRDPAWNVCRVVIARNPLTDTTSFTAEELQYIAEKLNLIKYNDLQPEIANNTSRINYAVTSIANVGNYVFDNKGHYDATRINNGKTVDSTTGNAYDSVGRCMTNVLNGTAYPMDAVYIDSTDYCIRLFGYSAQPVTGDTYLGCTDYIVGGKGNVLYRDPAWNICRMVIARNPTTDYTPFTTAEIEGIAAKLNLLKKQDKSVDVDYLEYRLLGLHTIPRNAGELNVIKRARQLTDMKWTSEINLPRVSMIDSDNYDSPANYVDDVFLADTEYTGVPYSSRNFVGTNVGINSFVTAMYNSQRSKMKESAKVDRDTAAMYGTVCVVLTSYALNLPVVASSYYHLIPDFTLIGTVPSTVNDIQLGDVIIEASHTALITDIIKENNTVKYVEVSESTKHGLENANKQGMQWGGICRRKLWTVSDYVRWFGSFSLYRYSKIASVPYKENRYINIGDGLGFRKNPYLACMPYEGDYWWYSRSASSVNVVIFDTHYTNLIVYKDGILLATYPITAQTESVTVSLDGAGYYTANLLDSNNHTSGSCHWMVNTTTDISYTVANGVASFTVKRDLDTPPVSVRFNNVNGNPVFSYHIHPVENLQKSFVNNQYVYTFTVPYDVETVQNYYVYLDTGEYGNIVIDRTIT